MQLVYDVVESAASPAVIKVIGIGGGGCNAINNMIDNKALNLLAPTPMPNLYRAAKRPSASS